MILQKIENDVFLIEKFRQRKNINEEVRDKKFANTI